MFERVGPPPFRCHHSGQRVCGRTRNLKATKILYLLLAGNCNHRTLVFSSHQENSNIEVAKMITRRIVQAEDWKDIRKSISEYESCVNMRHLTTAMYFLTKKNVRMHAL